MPITTLLMRENKPVELRWGGWHVMCLQEAMIAEGEPEGAPRFFMGFPNNPANYVFKENHRFVDESDGEIFEIWPGDEYSAHG